MKTKLKAIGIMLIYTFAGLIMTYIMYQISYDSLFILGFPIGVGLLWCIISIFDEIVKELNKKEKGL